MICCSGSSSIRLGEINAMRGPVVVETIATVFTDVTAQFLEASFYKAAHRWRYMMVGCF
jgi:hypothetical protein